MTSGAADPQAIPAPADPAAPQPVRPRPLWLRWLGDWWALVALALFCLFLILNVGFEKFLEYLLLGLPQGGIIALIAIGYSMVYGIIQLINFAHGEIFMFTAYMMLLFLLPLGGGDAAFASLQTPSVVFAVLLAGCAAVSVWTLVSDRLRALPLRAAVSVAAGVAAGFLFILCFRMAIPFWIALALVTAFSPVLGITMDTLAYKPLRHSPRLVPLITAIGMSFMLQNLAQLIFSAQTREIGPTMIPGWLRAQAPPETTVSWWTALTDYGRVQLFGDLTVPLINVVIVGLAVVMMIGVDTFVRRSKTGRAMRACALDQTTAKLVGINVNFTVAMTFAVGSALAAIAAPFFVIKYSSIEPTMGYIVGVLAFASAVLGGIGNIRGAMLGGFAIGIIYNFVPLFERLDNWAMIEWLASLPAFADVENWNKLQGITQWRLGVAYLFMILVIIFKPTGLLGQAAASQRA
ncbi:MAG: branched-chain amino acid ABC transporter permease [Sumerlaeia bacterium]